MQIGSRVGAFDILSKLGAGGMGEVYRARDTKLGRDVALKILPAAFASDPERLARFQREAQVLASLNHPHIAAIYGLESVEDTQFLVLELVDGETLDTRLKARPPSTGDGALAEGARGFTRALPVAEALDVARQVADALQAAHEKGIIHRDLKPSNIALTSDGQVKVLDFGLAKLEAAEAVTREDVDSATIAPLAGLSQSPTMVPAAMTSAGMILGTAPYMSPEQAKGRPADKRTDIWAFGCVLYEMLGGKPAFDGEDISDTLANILKSEPDWNALPVDLPVPIRTLLQRCIEKDRRKRTSDIAVAAFVLDESAALATSPTLPVATPETSVMARARPHAIGFAVAILAGAAMSGAGVWFAMRPRPAHVSRFSLAASPATALNITGVDRDIAISPDGSRVVYLGPNSAILVRELDQVDVKTLTTRGSPRGLFVSPDGQWVGFFDGNAIRKVPLAGGPPITICTVAGTGRGASWGADDSIVFATNDLDSGLWRVSAGGGQPAMLTTPNRAAGEADHVWPEFLPDGRSVLFTITPSAGSIDSSSLAMVDVGGGMPTVLLKGGTDARYVSTGHLLYAAAGTLRAVTFDAGRRQIAGMPVTVLPQVSVTTFGKANFDVASNGTLVYVPGGQGVTRSLTWVDRQGREEPINAPPRAYLYPRVSPDGSALALDSRDQDLDIWIWNFKGQTLRRLTFEPVPDRFPTWTPDGRQLFYASDRNGTPNVFRQAADGTGSIERITESPNLQVPTSVSPDGSRLVIRENRPNPDLMLLDLADKSRTLRPIVTSPFNENNGEISPDGRWIAYESNNSGEFEVYVRPFPDTTRGIWQVSTGGGVQPLWSPGGQELFYLTMGGALMTASVRPGPVWNAGVPAKVLGEGYYHGGGPGAGTARTYDISRDGKRFLMIKPGAAGDGGGGLTSLMLVENWFEELKRVAARR